ncbi:MAG: elongation factor G, partial [Planctomycetes bacterium]|nr:elongation factor G [Planctomycetota bacterium]
LERIHIAEPVISLAVLPKSSKDQQAMSKAFTRFMKEDPTFHFRSEEHGGETIVSGMGELHLDVYIERARREYKADLEVGAPKVNYREAPTIEVAFNHKHKKQTGGSGQYAHVIGDLIPLPESAEEDYEFENSVKGGRIPTEYIPSVDKGFQMARGKGPLAGFEIVGIKMHLKDGSHHAVDSSDLAFQICARQALKDAFLRARPVLLEPIMRVEIETPTGFQGSVSGDVGSRRGLITATEIKGPTTIISAQVPLANMFGYATDLRSQTQGQATFSMEFACYRKTPTAVQTEVIEQVKKAEKEKARK